MGREIRRAPLDWLHPRDFNGNYIPMFDDDYDSALAEFEEDPAAFDDQPPDPLLYRPDWYGQPLGYQVYENVSEGTPVSPVFATEAELVDWLADSKGVPLGIGGSTIRLSMEQARRFVEVGSSWSFTMSPTGLRPGILDLG